MHHLPPRFCAECGSPQIVRRIPAGDDHEREVCADCGHIFYFNPKIVVGALPIWQDRVLLCKRAIAPRHGMWTLPAGFMEEGETLEDGAKRETREEAGAIIHDLSLYTVISLPDISQVYMLFRAQLTTPEFAAGTESLDVQLFDERDIPWDTLAFRTISATLRYYFADRVRGQYPTYNETLRHTRTGV